MAASVDYVSILKKTLHDAVRVQQIRLYPVCDAETGHFLVLATGWDKQSWVDAVLFHARLVDEKVVIEEDNFEEGLTDALIVAGICGDDIIAHSEQDGRMAVHEKEMGIVPK
jgi:hypothetical protein